MDSETSESELNSVSIDQAGQTIEGHQVNIGGDARIEHVGDKISGDVVISGRVSGDVHVTYVQRAPVPPPPILQPPETDLFVGREAELAAYSDALEQAGIAVISGMAGVGKTALAAKLAKRIAKPDKIFWHSFHEDEGIDGVIWRLAGFLAANGEESIWNMLNSAGLSNSRPPPPELLFDYLVEQLRGRDFLLCLDDFQFVSDSDLLNQLVERIRPILLAGEARLILTSREVPDFVQLVSFSPLRGINVPDLGQLLAVNGLFLGDEQIAQLHDYTAGNAEMLTLAIDLLLSGYEVEEMLGSLVEADDIEDFLMDEVESRLTRNERLVMSAVALLGGYPGSQAAIEAILGGGRLRRQLRDLSDRFLLTVTRLGSERYYDQHGIVRDFFYDALNQRERVRMHLRAAAYYRDATPDTMAAMRHYLRGGEHAEVVALAIDNVYTLLNQGQATALNNLLSQIDREQLQARSRIFAHLVAGQVQSFLGQNEASKASFQAALAAVANLPTSAETAELHARACLGMSELLEGKNTQEALSWAEQGLRDANVIPDLLRAELLVQRGAKLMYAGAFEEARLSFEEGLALIPDVSTSLRGKALNNLAGLSFYAGEFEDGKSYGQQALAISRELNDHFEESRVIGNLALIEYVSGDWTSGIESFREALHIARQLGNPRDIMVNQLNLGKALINTGAHQEAGRLLNSTLKMAEGLGEELSLIITSANLAELHVYRNEWGVAQVDLDRAESLARKIGARTELPSIYAIWTEVAVNTGDTKEAQEYARLALTAADELGDPNALGIALRASGLALQMAGNVESAEAHFRQSADLLRELDPFQWARSQLALGMLLRESPGRKEEAVQMFLLSRGVFLSLGAESHLQQVEELLSA